MTKLNNDAYAGAELPGSPTDHADEAIEAIYGDAGIIGIDLASGPDKSVEAMVNPDGTVHTVWDSVVEREGENVYPLYDGNPNVPLDGGTITAPYLTKTTLAAPELADRKLVIHPPGYVDHGDPDDIELPGHYYRHDDDTFVKVELQRTPYSKSGIQYKPGCIPADDHGGYHEYLICDGMAYRLDWGERLSGPITPPPPGASQNGSESV